MIQLVVNDIFLDLYENDPIKLTYSIEDILDTKVTSVYSKNFRVPATKKNTEFFKTAFEINGFDFDVTIKINATILLDGQLLRKGQIRLQKIYLTNSGNAADYEILFLGESRDFASTLGQKLLKELDLSEFDTSLTWTNISQSWQAYPQNASLNAGLHSGDVLFPLVDFGNTYSGSDEIVEQTRIAVGTGRHFTNPGSGTPPWPIQVDRFKPMIRAKALWDKVFDEAGYTYESEFLQKAIFRQQYVSAWGNEPSPNVNQDSSNLFGASGTPLNESNVVLLYDSASGLNKKAWSLTNNFTASLTDGAPIPFTTGSYALAEEYDYANNYNVNTGVYNLPVDGYFRYNARLDLLILVKSGTDETFQFNHNYFASGPAGEYIFYYDYSQANFTRETPYLDVVPYRGPVVGTFDITVDANTNIWTGLSFDSSLFDGWGSIANIKQIYLIRNNSFINVDLAPGTLSISDNLKGDYKQIDFIKDIITKFRLVLVPDPNNTNNFIIEPWEDFIGSGEIRDWTNLLDLSKDVVIEPVFNTQKQKITFSDKEDKDWLNNLNVDQFNEIYGTLVVDSQNELLTDEREITTTLSPTPVRQIQGFVEQSTVANTFIIPHIYTLDSGEVRTLYKPTAPNTRLLFYNGLKSGNDTWYLAREITGQIQTLTTYPMVSPYSVYPLTNVSLDLNWQRENGYQYVSSSTSDIPQINLGISVYDRYWSSYIESLYDKWSRKVTAYFVLEGNDLRDFNFNDIIYVKGTYYYVEKIYDVPLDKKEPVKVDLIKYTPTIPNTGFIPPVPPEEFNIWGDWPVIWNTTTDIWDD